MLYFWAILSQLTRLLRIEQLDGFLNLQSLMSSLYLTSKCGIEKRVPNLSKFLRVFSIGSHCNDFVFWKCWKLGLRVSTLPKLTSKRNDYNSLPDNSSIMTLRSVLSSLGSDSIIVWASILICEILSCCLSVVGGYWYLSFGSDLILSSLKSILKALPVRGV